MNSVKDDPKSLVPRQRLSRGWCVWFNSIAIVLCLTIAGASPLQVVPLQVVKAAKPVVAKIAIPAPAASTAVRPVIQLAKPQAPTVPAGSDGIELLHEMVPSTPVAHIVWMEVTAYCPCTKCCGPNAQGLTASGKDITYNGGAFVAADTDVFAFNTRVSIPGYNGSQPVEVIDRGSAIKGNHLDVFFATHEQALEWGRRRLPITISQ
jgi:3D (Asp-Asp-Asp) domain-containing protein